MKKRLFILSALLLTICGQMWAGRSGNEVTKGIEQKISYTLYSNYSYYYDDPNYSCDLGDVAVITSFDDYQMIIPETLGGCSKIVIGSGALTSKVTDLQISKSVKLLEFNAVYNATNIESLTIADGTTLVCFGAGTPEQSMQNGSFSYIKRLQSVYLGGNLEYDDYSTKYNAPFYNLNTEQTFSLTIGPNVTNILEDCFGNCNDIKWIKAMPHTPPTLGYNALGTSNAVPVYVSYKTKDAYTSASGWSTFTNYVFDTDLCKADALNDLDAEAGENPSDAVQAIVVDYKGLINNATSGNEVVAKFNEGIAAIQLQKAKETAIAELTQAKKDNPSGAANKIFDTYKTRIEAATSIDDVIAAKEEGIMELQKYVEELEAEKASAEAELDAASKKYPSLDADRIVSDYEVIIEDAKTIEDVWKARDEGIDCIKKAYDNLQSIKDAAIAELDNAKKLYPSANASSIVAEGKDAIQNAKSQSEVINKKEYYIAQLMIAFTAELTNAKNDAINALNQAKDDYPSYAAEGIVSTYTGKINDATTKDAITAAEEEGIQALKDANELQNARETAIAELTSAVEEYPSDAAEGIVSTYTDIINAATSTDAITAAKEEGIQALNDAYNVQKEAERLAALDAVTVTQTAEDDYSYMLEDGVRFTFDGDNVYTTVNGQDKPGFTLSETVAIRICPARTFKLKANKDPDKPTDFYSTFYTSEGAYKVPEMVKAYIGEVKTGEKTDVLKLTDVGTIIHQSEAVILKATGSDITLMPSCNKDSTSTKNALEGTDKEKTLTTNQYALSLGQNGVGFYLWEGKSIGANKAYLTMPNGAKALAFEFNDEPSGIEEVQGSKFKVQGTSYNLNGIRVGDNYKGIVIQNGKKVLRR